MVPLHSWLAGLLARPASSDAGFGDLVASSERPWSWGRETCARANCSTCTDLRYPADPLQTGWKALESGARSLKV